MPKDFNVYKWRREQLTEIVDMGPLNKAIYNEIVEWLKKNSIDVKPHILDQLPKAIQFGILSGNRESINESELRGSWIDKKGTFNGKEYDGYFKTIFPKQDSEIKSAIKDKGYTYVGDEEWDDDERKTEYWYYFKK